MKNYFLTAAATLSLLSLSVGASAADAQTNTSSTAVSVYTTAKDSDQRIGLTDKLSLQAAHQPPETDIAIFVNPQIHYQTLVGIGGAITDASAETFAKLGKKEQQQLLDAYYSKDKGLGYSLMRTSIHSSDFSSGSYTYIKEGDKDLKTFSIKHDKRYRIPMIKRAIATAGGDMILFASPWSAPAFMKDTNNMLQGGKLLPEYADTWATYYTKFIKAYEKEGIPIWGISVQNEPMAKQTWESMIFTAEEERDFLKNHLGPTMEKAGLGDKKIIVWDHNRDLINYRTNVILSDPDAAKYVWGVGFHWYETWTGGKPLYANVAEVSKAFPNVKLMLTEATVEKFDASRYQYWPNGERYGDSIINDFNSGAVGWTDWNILLDDKGGPNHVGNFCLAPVHADTKTGKLIFTPSYYYLGHFAKFFRPGAERVSATSSRSVLQTTAFKNTDGTLATVVMNNSDTPVSYRYYVGAQETKVTIPAHAIQTLVYQL